MANFVKKFVFGCFAILFGLFINTKAFAYPISMNINLTMVTNGAQLNLQQVQNRLIFLEIFRADCPYCQEESSSIEKLYLKYRNYFLFVAVDPFDSRSSIIDFLNFTHVNYPTFTASQNSLAGFDITVTPSVYIILNGNIIGTAKGLHDYQEMDGWLTKIVHAVY